MELNRELLSQLDKIDDDKLRQAASAIAAALGANPMQAKMAARNIERFRRRAENMTDDELKEAASKIPPEKAAEIAKLLGLK